MTSVDVTDSRESGRRRGGHSSMPEIVRQANLSQAAYRISHEVGGDCHNLAAL
jgi:hypothetical protein